MNDSGSMIPQAQENFRRILPPQVVFLVDGSWAARRMLALTDYLDEEVWGDVPLPLVRQWLSELDLSHSGDTAEDDGATSSSTGKGWWGSIYAVTK